MILSAFTHGDEALVMTVSEIDGRYVKVAMTEEEMFRSILGNEEFEYRRAAAYSEAYNEPPPPEPKVANATIPVGVLKRGRYMSLKRGGPA